MKLPIFQVDAFTSRVFSGNPAAVVLLTEPLSAETMQAIAAENNLSETAFAQPLDAGSELGNSASSTGNASPANYGLRWFTPTMEVDLCGHATLATAFVLFQKRMVTNKAVHFQTPSGRLEVRQAGELLSMDFPSRPPTPASGVAEIAAALGARPREVLAARDQLAIFDSEDDVAALRPDFARIAALDAWAIIATAPGREVDFVSRFFAPKAGIDEDPVTGSAHCSLIPYWAAQLGKSRMRARQISQRGGELTCENRDKRVTIAGRAVMYLQGEISI